MDVDDLITFIQSWKLSGRTDFNGFIDALLGFQETGDLPFVPAAEEGQQEESADPDEDETKEE